MPLLEIDLLRFIGHLHPLLVHLPIGFLLLGGLFFLLANKSKYSSLHKALPITLFISMVSAVFAALFGWLLADDGGYAENILFWHRWSGVILTLFSVLAWLWSIGKIGRQNRQIGGGILSVCILLLFLAGHHGGQLTHGADYLKKALNGGAKKVELVIPDHPDSIIVYSHLVQPVLEQRCYNCHNEKTQNGDLDLSTWEGIQNGGQSGKVLNEEAYSSELFKRVTLPQNRKKFMPTKGEPMTFSEMTILKWWIDEGASPDARLTTLSLPDDIKMVLEKSYDIDTRPKPFVERTKVEALSEDLLNEARSLGWKVNYLGEDNYLLELSPISKGKIMTKNLEKLSSLATHITWLDISDCEVSDDQLKVLAEFSNLSRLRLQNNQITDAGLDYLSDLDNLESLNLYNNPITDQGLLKLSELSALKRLYLWQTKVTEEGKANLKSRRPDIEL